jgi:hypothetical protein
MWAEAMTELGTSAGIVGLLLGGALFLLVVTFVGLCVLSLRPNPDRQQHVLALLGRLTELAAALRSGTTPGSPPATPAPAVTEGAREKLEDNSGDNR